MTGALIGDAAGAVSLMAGQGAVLAMVGANALAGEPAVSAEINATPVPGTDGRAAVSAALARYEAEFRPPTIRAQSAGRRTARWLVPAGRGALRLRAAALRVLDLPGAGPLIRTALAPANRP
jgi:2-polyprenyl-6-methoxyphenol hydroxylase-like FAD-dependent oxidoreductase